MRRTRSYNRIDIFFCLLKSPEREKLMSFIPVELYRVQHILVTRKGNPLDIKNYEQEDLFEDNNDSPF